MRGLSPSGCLWIVGSVVALAAALFLAFIVALWMTSFPSHDTPLVLAASQCSVEAVERLLDEGADPNETASGFSPAMAAAGGPFNRSGEGCLETLEVLVAAGADVRALSGSFADSIFRSVALNQDDPEVVWFLVANGADVCRRLSDEMAEKFGTRSVAELAELEGWPKVAEALGEAAADCSPPQEGFGPSGLVAIGAVVAAAVVGSVFFYRRFAGRPNSCG